MNAPSPPLVAARPQGVVLAALLTQTAIAVGTYLVAKRVTAELPPLTVVAVRSLASAALLLLLLRLLPGPFWPPRRLLLPLAVFGFLAGPVNQGTFLYGLSTTSPAHASLLYALTPAGVYLVSLALRREAFLPRRVTGIAIAFTGVAVLLLGRGLSEARGTVVGDLWVLLAVSAWVVVTLEGKRLSAELGPLKTSAWMLVFAGLQVLPAAPWLISVPALEGASSVALGGVAYLIVCSSVASYLLWNFALSRVDASSVSVFANLQPVGTALAAWAVFGQAPTWALAAGGALVLAGVRLAQAR